MAKIILDYMDGQYTTLLLSEEEAAEREARGEYVAHIQDCVYDAYLQHCAQDTVWQTLWRAISNEQYMRRREQELLPLEDAQREINRLKDDLARAERMHRHYEDEWLHATGRQTRTEKYGEGVHEDKGAYIYTCIFPQPGCDLAVLESPEWQASAAEILQEYNVRGSRHQGCCCGHTHRLLDPATAQRLRAAGFLVENESESEECA